MTAQPDIAEILAFYAEAGIDEVIGDTPVDRYAASAEAMARRVPAVAPAPKAVPPPRAAAAPRPAVPTAATTEAAQSATQAAKAATTLDALKSAVEGFDGCALKATATSTVFADGVSSAEVMIIGEAPGADEDRRGLPFVGASGKLLDKMLASIGLDRASNAYITNVLPWRPPGNRKPTPQEVAICLPFLERHIELMDPKALFLVGGLSAKVIFATDDGIMRARGKWRTYESSGLSHPIPALATFHPAYLLRQPQHKRLAWRDLLALRRKLDDGV